MSKSDAATTVVVEKSNHMTLKRGFHFGMAITLSTEGPELPDWQRKLPRKPGSDSSIPSNRYLRWSLKMQEKWLA
jgi:hypothetical protein